MKQRLCIHCHKPIPKEMRLGTDFCSDACRAKNWRKKNPKPKTNSKQEIIVQDETTQNNAHSMEGLMVSLRGLIENNDSQHSLNTEPVTNEKPQLQKQSVEPTLDDLISGAIKKRDDLDLQCRKLSSQISECAIHLKMVKGEFISGRISKYVLQSPAQKIESRNSLEKEKKLLEQQHLGLRQEWSKVFIQIMDWTEQKKKQSAFVENQPPQIENTNKIFEKPLEIKNPPAEPSFKNLISSNELMKLTYQSLNFTEKWFDFLGQTSPLFHAVVHGKPGGGKSTFCFQFAHYLAEKFGRVVYISAEEGFSKTLQDKLKLVNTKELSNNLSFGAQKNFDQIKKEIPLNYFHFIFIDSLDTLKIDAGRLMELREHYRNSAFITISQSTKDGKMRGSQEIVHDCDIEIQVENGVAITKKNRFKVTGKMFMVFNDGKDSTVQIDRPMEPPRNVV